MFVMRLLEIVLRDFRMVFLGRHTYIIQLLVQKFDNLYLILGFIV